MERSGVQAHVLTQRLRNVQGVKHRAHCSRGRASGTARSFLLFWCLSPELPQTMFPPSKNKQELHVFVLGTSKITSEIGDGGFSS